ncbi:MAG: Rpn family recombination-promoting nuclease/putative transposase [Lachnospiraceae bacterium]|jgi:predicted transposase/invertase (TIGR01784 family)|nr:Rpn family recombination-promoting nuclease/putative transposase [Lachnospiraceae bacterium]
MENRKKDWESLGLSNDFLFGKVMRNPELCKEMLELILGVEIERLEYPEAQKNINEEKDAKGVRLDVYVRNGSGEIYNIEVQALDTEELPKRSRYYSSMIDLQELNKGEPYWKLKQSYVIFICTFDLFGEGRHRYTFENVCIENTGIRLKDGTTKIFLNTEGTAEDISGELKAFLDYVGGRESDNGFVKRLAKEMEKAKQNREWRREYMTLLMRDQENLERGIKQGIKQGIEQGEERFAVLNRRLLQDKRYDDLERVLKDKAYRQKLYEKYNII